MSAQQIALDALAAKIKADDAILGKLGTDVTTIASGVTGLQKTSADLQSQLDALKKQNPALDFTGVDAAMASFDSDLGTVLTAADSVVTTLTPAP